MRMFDGILPSAKAQELARDRFQVAGSIDVLTSIIQAYEAEEKTEVPLSVLRHMEASFREDARRLGMPAEYR